MQQKMSQSFIELLEAVVTEDSTTIQLSRNMPRADALIKYMHQKGSLAHDIEYDKVDKISWSDIRKHSVVIIQGKAATAVLKIEKASYGNERHYEAYVADEEGQVDTRRTSSGPEILNWIRPRVGRISGYYLSRNINSIKDKKDVRKSRKHVPSTEFGDSYVFTNQMIARLKPLWLKALHAAHSDIKGFIGIQLKSNALSKVNQRLQKLIQIDGIIKSIEDDTEGNYSKVDNYPEIIKTAIYDSIQMTAYHYYPEESGGFEQRRYGRTQHQVRNQDAVKKIFDDIRNGDTSRLGTIISFFKRSLMAA